MTDINDQYDAGWVNHQLREYYANLEKLDQLKEQKKKELAELNAYYFNHTNQMAQENELIKEDLRNYLDQFGMTGVTTSMGNVHFMTKGDKINWQDLKAKELREVGKHLPDEYVNRVPNKSAIKKNTIIDLHGNVVFKDTGEIIPGITGEKGGTKTVAIRKG